MNDIKYKEGVTWKNRNNLPVIQCPSLYKLVELVEKAQNKGSSNDNVVFDQGSRMKDCDLLRGPALEKPWPAKPRFFPLMPERAGSIPTWNEDLRLELGTNGSHA